MPTRHHAISLMAAKFRSAGAIRFAIAPYELIALRNMRAQ